MSNTAFKTSVEVLEAEYAHSRNLSAGNVLRALKALLEGEETQTVSANPEVTHTKPVTFEQHPETVEEPVIIGEPVSEGEPVAPKPPAPASATVTAKK